MDLQSVFSEIQSTNPLDLMEEIVAANQWPYDRSGDAVRIPSVPNLAR
jgi:hypothetical protein